VFNFGFFDFAQKGFLQNFLRGRLLYFVAAQPAQQEFSQYINENRSIRVQRLALAPEQALKLADFLVNEAQPANRDYLYDYYWNNCSTRVRDALDSALGESAQSLWLDGGRMNMRDQTRRLTMRISGCTWGWNSGSVLRLTSSHAVGRVLYSRCVG
jgi:hypothetical protein